MSRRISLSALPVGEWTLRTTGGYLSGLAVRT
jgi:hypothetical protein